MTEQSKPPSSQGPDSGPASIETFLRLSDIGADARSMSDEDFAARYGDTFLLHYGPLGTLSQSERRGQTDYKEEPAVAPSGVATRNFIVFPLRISGRSPFPNFISIGRVRNNDVIIEEASLSKFHAYLRRGDDGIFVIQDSGSTNGTWVDDKPVPVRDKGPPLPLRSGANIRLGSVRVSFVTAAQVRELARRSTG